MRPFPAEPMQMWPVSTRVEPSAREAMVVGTSLVENLRRGGNVAFGLPKLLGRGFSITCLAFAFLLSGGGLATDGFGAASAPALPAKVFADCAGSVL